MPYIKQERRKELDPIIDALAKELMWYDSTLDKVHVNYGDINYVVSKVFKKIFEANSKYDTVNSLVGVLECIKMEYYSQQARPYEDLKIKENGDI